MIDPWYFYAGAFLIGLILGGVTIGLLIARDPSVVKLEEGMVVTSRDFVEKIQRELEDLRAKLMR